MPACDRARRFGSHEAVSSRTAFNFPLLLTSISYCRRVGTVSPHLSIVCGQISRAAANSLMPPKNSIASCVFILFAPFVNKLVDIIITSNDNINVVFFTNRRLQMKIQPYKEGMKLDGFIAGMPNEVYHASPGVSKSGLDKINRSPAHYKFAPEVAQTRNMVLGAAMHAALLEPGLFEQEYLLLRDVKDRRVSAYKEAIKNHPENK